ncbi:MAG: hypothetical protein ABR600_14055 [Actinomycetota bacterium]
MSAGRWLSAMLLATLGVLLLPSAAFAATADLAVSMADSPDPVTVGDDLVYTVAVTNLGTDDATTVSLDVTVPPETSFGSVTGSGTCTEVSAAVHCDLGTVADGATASIVIVIAPLGPGTLQSTATVSGGPGDPDGSNNNARAQTEAEGSACSMTGTWSDDTLTGSEGNDVLCGLGGDDVLIGGAGDDVLYGGSMSDVVSFLGATEPVHVSLRTGEATGEGSDQLAQIEAVDGSRYDDVLSGSDEADALRGDLGNDVILGRDGDDVLDGGAGDDFIAAGPGSDTLTGGSGIDTCVLGTTGGSHTDACPGRTRPDEPDTRGPFDVSSVTLSGSNRITVRVDTYSRWNIFGMWDHGEFLVQLDTAGSADIEDYVLVRSTGRRLLGALFHAGPARDVHRFPVRVGHPGGHVLSVVIPLRRIGFGPGRAYYRWSVQSMWNERPCARVCFDSVDDDGPVPEIRP